MADVDLEPTGLAARLARELPAKVAVWLGLAVGICVPYFTLQHVAWFPVRSVPATPIDAWIPLTPDLLWVYFSLGALVPLGPALATRRDELRRYAWGLFWLCLPCFVLFAVFPVAGPRPELAPEHRLYHWLVAYDRPTNSMPSLHAGLTVYSLLFLWRVARLPRPVEWLGVAWGGLIFYATLATKQHWLVDLPVGAALACIAHAAAWRGAGASPPAPRGA
ncbi:MAG: phosphatase PAP2 family protein [Myxococcota bacterium]